MDKTSNFVINGGGIRLPVGYRFCPTDEELVEHYLKRKVFNLPLPASVIPEFDVFLTDPWGLPGDVKEKRFFFSKQKSFLRRSVGCGIWKSTGKEKFIWRQGINQVLGLRKSLVFSDSKFSDRTRTTRWVMHEYRLARPAITPYSNQMEMEDWAVYCLFQKRRRTKKQGVDDNQRLAVVAHASLVMDLTVEDGWEFPQPCSSCSSGVTEVPSNGTESTDQEQTSSGLDIGVGFPLYSQAHVRGV